MVDPLGVQSSIRIHAFETIFCTCMAQGDMDPLLYTDVQTEYDTISALHRALMCTTDTPLWPTNKESHGIHRFRKELT